jgi:hypothetical protein
MKHWKFFFIGVACILIGCEPGERQIEYSLRLMASKPFVENEGKNRLSEDFAVLIKPLSSQSCPGKLFLPNVQAKRLDEEKGAYVDLGKIGVPKTAGLGKYLGIDAEGTELAESLKEQIESWKIPTSLIAPKRASFSTLNSASLKDEAVSVFATVSENVDARNQLKAAHKTAVGKSSAIYLDFPRSAEAAGGERLADAICKAYLGSLDKKAVILVVFLDVALPSAIPPEQAPTPTPTPTPTPPPPPPPPGPESGASAASTSAPAGSAPASNRLSKEATRKCAKGMTLQPTGKCACAQGTESHNGQCQAIPSSVPILPAKNTCSASIDKFEGAISSSEHPELKARAISQDVSCSNTDLARLENICERNFLATVRKWFPEYQCNFAKK